MNGTFFAPDGLMLTGSNRSAVRMTTHEQNKKAIQQGQQGGPAQKNQNAQGALGAEQEEHSRSGIQQGGGGSAGQQQQGNPNPGQTGTPGGQGKQDAPQNQKR
jgi:hypothetical protein